jgi:hypothetical protein
MEARLERRAPGVVRKLSRRQVAVTAATDPRWRRAATLPCSHRRHPASRLLLAATLVVACVAGVPTALAQYTTTNFVVVAPDPAFARQVGDLAETYRKKLAIQWLGHELDDWSERCPIRVDLAQYAGGETSFAFTRDASGRSAPFAWQMKVFGPADRILDSVLPHEVTHTIFATYFGRPLPRWADEGACTTVEHTVEREKNHRMLIEFLTTGRGIPFNRMFAMTQYPDDILPLYAQGHSLARYLLMQRGHQHFVNYIEEGMRREVPGRQPQTWSEVTKDFYGYDDLSDLQVSWVAWVRDGCPDLGLASTDAPSDGAEALATTSASELPVDAPASPIASEWTTDTVAPAADIDATAQSVSWYVAEMRRVRKLSEEPYALDPSNAPTDTGHGEPRGVQPAESLPMHAPSLGPSVHPRWLPWMPHRARHAPRIWR